jgi:hypothetical protein
MQDVLTSRAKASLGEETAFLEQNAKRTEVLSRPSGLQYEILKAGEGKSIHGSSPWVIASTQINSLQIYFQGSKVMIPKDAGQRIVLKEQALQN